MSCDISWYHWRCCIIIIIIILNIIIISVHVGEQRRGWCKMIAKESAAGLKRYGTLTVTENGLNVEWGQMEVKLNKILTDETWWSNSGSSVDHTGNDVYKIDQNKLKHLKYFLKSLVCDDKIYRGRSKSWSIKHNLEINYSSQLVSFPELFLFGYVWALLPPGGNTIYSTKYLIKLTLFGTIYDLETTVALEFVIFFKTSDTKLQLESTGRNRSRIFVHTDYPQCTAECKQEVYIL